MIGLLNLALVKIILKAIGITGKIPNRMGEFPIIGYPILAVRHGLIVRRGDNIIIMLLIKTNLILIGQILKLEKQFMT